MNLHHLLLLLLISGLWSPSSARFRYYYLVTEQKTWDQAQSYCRQKYTDLATVDNMAEMQELKGFIPPGFSDSIWIGLKRGSMRLWGWSSGEVFQYTNWNPGEPNGVITDRWCGGLYKFGGWIDTSCTNMYEFICYSEPLGKFVLVKIPSNWRDAETYCRQYYTNLATIHSDQEQQQVWDLLTNSAVVWIGLGFDNWLWSDGRKTTFRYWHPGQPYSATDDGNCAMVSTSWGGDWDDTACNGVMSFMCYKVQANPDAPAPTPCLRTARASRARTPRPAPWSPGLNPRTVSRLTPQTFTSPATIKRGLIKLKVTSGGETDLNNPVVMTNILTQIDQTLRKHGVGSDTTLTWQMRKGKVFSLEKTKEEQQKCSRLNSAISQT